MPFLPAHVPAQVFYHSYEVDQQVLKMKCVCGWSMIKMWVWPLKGWWFSLAKSRLLPLLVWCAFPCTDIISERVDFSLVKVGGLNKYKMENKTPTHTHTHTHIHTHAHMHKHTQSPTPTLCQPGGYIRSAGRGPLVQHTDSLISSLLHRTCVLLVSLQPVPLQLSSAYTISEKIHFRPQTNEYK